MNYLAHLYLSNNRDKVIIGNFIGDFVKGKKFELFEDDIKKGILLHREIDRFTDSNEIVKRSKKRLQPIYRHYSPVITDVFYDHYLSSNWGDYSDVDLKDYTESFYKLAEQYSTIIPEQAQNMLKYMKAGNWLFHYQYIDGIHQALSGMSKRTKFESKMELASKDLEKYYDDFKSEFVEFFPLLIAHSKGFLNELGK